jgi:hypothetical protein
MLFFFKAIAIGYENRFSVKRGAPFPVRFSVKRSSVFCSISKNEAICSFYKKVPAPFHIQKLPYGCSPASILIPQVYRFLAIQLTDVLLAPKFARKALATSKEDVQVHWLGDRLCFGVGLGRGVAEGANTTQ